MSLPAPFSFAFSFVHSFCCLFGLKQAQELKKGAVRFQARSHLVSCLITCAIDVIISIRAKALVAPVHERKGLRVKNHGGVSDSFELILGHHDSEDPKRVEKGWVG